MRFFHIVMNTKRESPTSLYAVSPYRKLGIGTHMLEEITSKSYSGKHGITKLPLQLNLRDKIGGKRGGRVVLDGACLYLEGEISE